MKLEFLPRRIDLPFVNWRKDVHSQFGEDGIIEALLRQAGASGPGYFVEFGAWDGRHLSNCAKLADEGWAGCFIEGDAERHTVLQKNYAERPQVSTLHAFVTSRGAGALDVLLDSVGAPEQPSVMSIDVDGTDYYIWEAVERHKPLLCLIEFNPTVPAEVSFVQDDDPSVHQGCSLTALDELGRRKGYRLVAATALNGFFMRDDVCREKGIAVYEPHQVKDQTYEAALFHGYDGRMLVAGHRDLLWHGIPYGAGELQVLPTDLQVFGPAATPEVSNRIAAFRDARPPVKA